MSFDLSVYDIFGTLAAGATVRLATRDELRDPQGLVRTLCSEPITFWDSAPAALQQLVPWLDGVAADAGDLRLVFLSGDWVPLSLPGEIRRNFPKTRVISLGGATEATVWSNYFVVDDIEPRLGGTSYLWLHRDRPIPPGDRHDPR